MQKYSYQPRSKQHVKVLGSGLRISTKSSAIVCRAVTGLTLPKARSLVDGLVSEKKSLDGKYYTNVSKELSYLLAQAESNAEFKTLEPSRLIVHASAHEGFTFYTPRRFKLRRKKRKITHIQLVLNYK